MGLLISDITPIGTNGPTILTPTSKDVVSKCFSTSRSDTAATVKCILPADASIVEVSKFGSSNTDSATSSTMTLTVTNNTGTISSGSFDAKTTGTTTAHVQMTNLPNLEPRPLTGDITISAQYTEVGAATTGGPWIIKVLYVR